MGASFWKNPPAAVPAPKAKRAGYQRVADLPTPRPTSCLRCRGELSINNKSGVCLPCKRAAKAAKAAAGCVDCGGAKGFRAKRCAPCGRRHLDTDPRIRASRSAKCARRRRDRLASDPAFAAQLSAHARELGSSSRGRRFKMPADAIVRRSATRLAWCPEDYRPLYRELRKTVSAREARRLVEEQVRVDHGRMSPFERQVAAVRAGAAVTDKPDLRPSRFELAGGSSLAQFEGTW